MENNILSLLVKQMEDEKDTVMGVTMDGTAKDFAEYRAMCGTVKGLALAQRIVLDMQARLKQQDE